MKLLLSVILFSLTFTQLASQNLTAFPLWLTGTWVIESENGSSYEQWIQINDSVLTGKIFRLFDSDTLTLNYMKIGYKDNDIVLEMAANKDNSQVIADFILQRTSPDLWTFVNKYVDFPQEINYLKKSDNSIYFWTSSERNNVECVDFIMTRKYE